VVDDVDLLVCPTVPTTAPSADHPRLRLPSGVESVDTVNLRYLGLANLTGIPAISVPVGMSHDGLPIALSLHAAWAREGLLLAAAESLESRLGPGCAGNAPYRKEP
jgi:Asp-tRNA(Asn)/Glu-tRNA(Gln) amidotransferase A subunit family amidase